MTKIMEWDRELFLWLNGFHTPWLDDVMYLMTKTIFWLPLYLLLLYVIFKNYRVDGLFILIGLGVAIALANTITSELMKPYFARLRPSHEPTLDKLIHIINGYRGGQYGFASSHAANTFASAVMLWLVFKKTYRWFGLIFLWAVLATYTRIYLGVHYPGDIITGLVIGGVCGCLGFLIFKALRTRWGMVTSKSD
jgi:undecaprenyl-diphosphatase